MVPEGPMVSGLPFLTVSHNSSPILCFSGDQVLAFGGQGEDPEDPKEPGNPLDTLMVLDPDIMLWYPPGVSGDKPTPRAGASLTYLNNKVVLFGGVKRRKFVNEVYSLDPCMLPLDCIANFPFQSYGFAPPVTWRWERPVIRGKAPLGRCYHSATAVGDKLVSARAGVACTGKSHRPPLRSLLEEMTLRTALTVSMCWIHLHLLGLG